MGYVKEPIDTELEKMCKTKRELTKRCDDLLHAIKTISSDASAVQFKPYLSVDMISIELPKSQALPIFELELHRKTVELGQVTEALNRAESALKA